MNSEKNRPSSLKKVLQHPFYAIKRLYDVLHNYPKLASQNRQDHEEMLKINHFTNQLLGDVEKIKKNQVDTHEEVLHRVQLLDDRLNDIVHQMSLLNNKRTVPESSKTSSNQSSKQLLANEHVLDSFYVEFEKWFRGSEAELAQRQSVYLPYILDSKLDSKKYPVVDIGCGNGEFVGLLSEKGIRAIGLDLNETMINRVKEKGLEGVQADALTYLRSLESNSLMAITGFHIVEHIPFMDLILVLNECYRTLHPDGFIIFETPDPENVIVGTCNFYSDPSHLTPIPPAFLEFVVKTRGFHKTEIKRLHPIKPSINHPDPLVQEMAERFYGPQDYAAIGYK